MVLDDIADSFDYKNKYAIIEYLNDIRRDDNFHLMVLTHNYDFYRTVRGRVGIYGGNKLLCNRLNGAIQLIPDRLSDNPFEDWKNQLDDKSVLVASIPFVRNLAEYVGNAELFSRLTSLLHIKVDTKNITIHDLAEMYGSILTKGTYGDFGAKEGTVFELLMSACAEICQRGDDDLRLEEKITLAIGIRLVAEELLIAKINDDEYVKKISSSQTGKLIRKFEKMDGCDETILAAVKRVALMTPENIHLNSFMFEPILDMSGHHLVSLFEDVKLCAEAA